MKKADKALLLSALVVPGAGHFFLKRHVMGAIFLVPTLVALIFIIKSVMQRATVVVDKILGGAAPADFQSILAMVSEAPADSGVSAMTIATFVVAGCWIIGMVDSYRLGKMEDEKEGKSESGVTSP